MSVVRVEYAVGFRGDDVVLVAMDRAGVAAVAAALNDAVRHGSALLQQPGLTHEFQVRPGKATVEILDDRVVWRLDHAKAAEISSYLEVLRSADRSGHRYVDIREPADTLSLSCDEYVGQS